MVVSVNRNKFARQVKVSICAPESLLIGAEHESEGHEAMRTKVPERSCSGVASVRDRRATRGILRQGFTYSQYRSIRVSCPHKHVRASCFCPSCAIVIVIVGRLMRKLA